MKTNSWRKKICKWKTFRRTNSFFYAVVLQRGKQ